MDENNLKNSQRNKNGDNLSVNDEVQKLFKKSNGKISQQDFQMLKNKYNNDELVNKIQKAFIDKHTHITKKAKKFAQLIREKYADSNYPFHVLIEKAYKYKVKHRLTDEEFSEFQRIYENELVGMKSPDVLAYPTNLQNVLGNVSINYMTFQINYLILIIEFYKILLNYMHQVKMSIVKLFCNQCNMKIVVMKH